MERETDGWLLFLAWWHVLVFLTRTMGTWQQQVTMATFKVARWDYDNSVNSVRFTSDEVLVGISDTHCFSLNTLKEQSWFPKCVSLTLPFIVPPVSALNGFRYLQKSNDIPVDRKYTSTSIRTEEKAKTEKALQQIMQLSVLNNVSQIGHGYIIILGGKR